MNYKSALRALKQEKCVYRTSWQNEEILFKESEIIYMTHASFFDMDSDCIWDPSDDDIKANDWLIYFDDHNGDI